MNLRFIATAYVILQTVYFFPAEIDDDDQYGMVRYISF